MNINDIPPLVLAIIFTAACVHIAVAACRWATRPRKPALPCPTYWLHGQQISAAEFRHLQAQRQAELDRHIEDALRAAAPRPDYGLIVERLAANEAQRNLTDARLRAWVEGK